MTEYDLDKINYALRKMSLYELAQVTQYCFKESHLNREQVCLLMSELFARLESGTVEDLKTAFLDNWVALRVLASAIQKLNYSIEKSKYVVKKLFETEYVIPNDKAFLDGWEEYVNEPGSPPLPPYAVSVSTVKEMAKALGEKR